jgi:hypothetical protein
MSADPLADLAVAAVFEALAIPITYRPRYGEPVVVGAVQVRPPLALDALGGGRVPEIVAREINAAAEASGVLRRYGG